MKVSAQIPVRIDFGGPWTDTPEFYESEPQGGATVNAAIVPMINGCHGAARPAHVTGIMDPGVSLSDSPQIKVGGPSGTLTERLVRGTSVSYQAGIPTSGLGTSAALNALWLGLIFGVREELDTHEERLMIAEKSHRIERELDIVGGKQDQYGAVFGGINLFVFHQDGRVDVEPLGLSTAQVHELEQCLILFDTGKTRLSSTLHEYVWGNYRAGANRGALIGMRDIAHAMVPVMQAGDWPEFGRLLSENWEHQKALHPSITNEQIESLFDIMARLGVWGGKACGAGGGGCLLFAVDPANRQRIEGVLDHLPGEIIPFQFDFQGLVVERTD